MKKKIRGSLLVLSMLLMLSGCWDYRGLDEMSIVTGVAIDKKPGGGGYLLSFETVDLTLPVKEHGLKSLIVESEGKTIFDAVRNAKKRITNKLYFGQAQLIIISEEIASSEDFTNIVDWFLRDGECRETICTVISQEKTARDVIIVKGASEAIISHEIFKILNTDPEVTSSTLCFELYEIFNNIKAKGEELALPVFHIVKNDEMLIPEANGMAIFKDDKLVGFLPPDESKFYMFAIDEVKGGVLPMSSSGEKDDFTLEISENKTDTSFEYKDGKLKVNLKTKTTVYLDEVEGNEYSVDEGYIDELEKVAEKQLEESIRTVIKKVQSEYGSDIFGFGNMIYKKDLKVWKQLSENWEEHFRSLEVEVDSEIQIVSTAFLKVSKRR